MPRPVSAQRLAWCCIALAGCILGILHIPQCASASPGGGARGGNIAPYETKRTSLDLTLSSASTGCKGDECKLKIDLTYPTSSPGLPGDAPVVVIISGFQAQMAYYHYLASALAAEGYVVVQYQTIANLFDAIARLWIKTITDARELEFLAPVLKYSEEYAHQRLKLDFADFSTIALVGHSRGGKLAALHYARALAKGDPRFKTALLLDPVDATQWSPVGPDYPSAVAALAGHPAPLAIAGAGVGWDRGFGFSCNPAGSNSTQFAKVAAPGSSYYVLLPRTGHMQFIEGNIVEEGGFNLLCAPWDGNNTDARQVAVALAVNWLDHQLRGRPAPDAPGSALCTLVKGLGRSAARLQKKGADGRWKEAACAGTVRDQDHGQSGISITDDVDDADSADIVFPT